MIIKQKCYDKQFGVVKNGSQNDKTYCNANSNMPLNNMKFLKFGNSEIWGYFAKIKINNKKIMSRHKKSLFLALFCKLYFIFQRLSNKLSYYLIVTF